MLREEFIKTLFEFFAASQKTLFEMTKLTKPETLTQIHYNILEYLYFNDGKSLSDLADCMYLSMPNASREVKKLKEKNMVKKVDDITDKRKHYIFLSDEGRTLMKETFDSMIIHLESKFISLDKNDQVELEGYMQKIIKKLF